MLCVQLPSSLLIGGIIERLADSTPAMPASRSRSLCVVAIQAFAFVSGGFRIRRDDQHLVAVEAGVLRQHARQAAHEQRRADSSTIVIATWDTTSSRPSDQCRRSVRGAGPDSFRSEPDTKRVARSAGSTEQKTPVVSVSSECEEDAAPVRTDVQHDRGLARRDHGDQAIADPRRQAAPRQRQRSRPTRAIR